jgi:K+-sensing histidine kinase KdpD
LRNVDELDSAFSLVISFFGALATAVIAIATRTTDESIAWLLALLLLVASTSSFQGSWAAFYNGLAVGLSYNFFFLSPDRQLRFDSASDLWVQMGFFTVASLSSWTGRVVRSCLCKWRAESKQPSTQILLEHPSYGLPTRRPSPASKGDEWTSG